jgi:hypothetical protein
METKRHVTKDAEFKLLRIQKRETERKYNKWIEENLVPGTKVAWLRGDYPQYGEICSAGSFGRVVVRNSNTGKEFAMEASRIEEILRKG